MIAVRRWLTALVRRWRKPALPEGGGEMYGPTMLPWQEVLRRSTEKVPRP